MINVPMKKSEYLNVGDGATLEKITEITNIVKFIGEFKPSEVEVIVLMHGGKMENKLSSFVPGYYIAGEEVEVIEYVDNLLYTSELNPPEEVIIRTPDGRELFVVTQDEYPGLIDEMYDVSDKLRDCIDTLRSGNKLDATQDAFLRMHKIIE